jgi:hypothetical protein
MTIKIKFLIQVLTFATLISCADKQTVFNIFNCGEYSIEIPNYYYQEGDGKWLYTKNNSIEYLFFHEPMNDNMSLNNALSLLLKMNISKNPKLNFMEFQQQKNLTVNNNQYLISFYEMNNNKNPNGYKVMSYFIFAVAKINDKIIFVETYSTGRNNQANMEKSVLSIKLKNR